MQLFNLGKRAQKSCSKFTVEKFTHVNNNVTTFKD